MTAPGPLTYDALREMILALPDAVETASSFKVNGRAIAVWNRTWNCPVFKVSFDERDLLVEADPETFFTTDHHRAWPVVLARPERVDHGWVRANLERVWRAQVAKRTLRAHDAARSGSGQ